jgi:hypothetical protein
MIKKNCSNTQRIFSTIQPAKANCIKKLIMQNMKPLRLSVLLIIAMLLLPPRALAYEEDTHFLITHVMLRSVGHTPEEALPVAAADQGMDE